MPRLRRTQVMLLALQLLFAVSTIASTTVPTRYSLPTFSRRVSLSHSAHFERNHPLLKSSILSIRGGSDYDEEDEDYDDDEQYDLDDGDFDVVEDDFAEENTLDRMVDAWEKTPPLTKALCSASFAATMMGFLFNKNQFPSILLLDWKPVLKKMQVWRPLTAFLNFGPFGIGYPLMMHFVWTYMSTLERLHHDRPYDFWIMILFGCLSMVSVYTFGKMSTKFLGHNLSTFLVYVWSRYHEGVQVNMFELFNTRAELIPWFFLAQTFLLEGEPPILDFLGIVFGHVYHHCKTTGMLQTPQFVIDWYNSDNRYSTKIRNKYKTISSDFELQ